MASSNGSRFRGRNNSQASPEKEKAAPPIWSRRLWTGSANVEVSVFSKIVNEGTQNAFQVFSVAPKRSFKDDDGYKSTTSFRPEDLATLASLILQAHAFITEQVNRE